MKSYFHQKSIFFGICLLTILLAGCRQTDEVDTKVDIPFPPKYIQSNLTGSVFDAYGKAVIGAKVSVGKESTETDEYGHFQFSNVWVSDPQDHLIVSKDGFFMEQVSVHAFAGDYSYQQIGLVDKIFSSSFSSDSPATFDYAGVYDVNIPAQALVTANGSSFSGIYKVSAKYSLQKGIDANQNLVFTDKGSANLLSETGGFAMEFRSVKTNERLFLSKEIEFFLPSSMVQDDQHAAIVYELDLRKWSPTEIHKNSEGRTYLNLKKTDFISIGKKSEFSIVEGTAKTKKGWGLAFSELETQDQHSRSQNTLTSASGRFRWVLPSDNQYQLSVESTCKDHIYSASFQTQKTHQNFDIVCDSNSIEAYALNGFALDCNGLTITNGYLRVEFDQNSIVDFPIHGDGNFHFNIFPCANEKLIVSVIHPETSERSSPLEISTNTKRTLDLRICENKSMGLARFVIETVDTIFMNCRVKIISQPNQTNAVFIFEFGSESNQFAERIFLERSAHPQGGQLWKITQGTFLYDKYIFKEVISPPEMQFIQDGNFKILECSLPNLAVQNRTTQQNSISSLIYFKAVIN